MEAMEKVSLDLDKLQNLINDTKTSTSLLDQPAVRALTTEALQKATALCSVLVTILQEMPPL